MRRTYALNGMVFGFRSQVLVTCWPRLPAACGHASFLLSRLVPPLNVSGAHYSAPLLVGHTEDARGSLDRIRPHYLPGPFGGMRNPLDVDDFQKRTRHFEAQEPVGSAVIRVPQSEPGDFTACHKADTSLGGRQEDGEMLLKPEPRTLQALGVKGALAPPAVVLLHAVDGNVVDAKPFPFAQATPRIRAPPSVRVCFCLL